MANSSEFFQTDRILEGFLSKTELHIVSPFNNGIKMEDELELVRSDKWLAVQSDTHKQNPPIK